MSMDEYITKKEALRVISDIFFETAPDGTDQLAVLKCSRAVRALPAVDRMLNDSHKIDLTGLTPSMPLLIRYPLIGPCSSCIMECEAYISGLEVNAGEKTLSLTFDVLNSEKKDGKLS